MSIYSDDWEKGYLSFILGCALKECPTWVKEQVENYFKSQIELWRYRA